MYICSKTIIKILNFRRLWLIVQQLEVIETSFRKG